MIAALSDIDFTAFVWFFVVALVLLAILWAGERWMDRTIEQPIRVDQHIPADEYRLLGDSIWELVRTRFESHTRTRLAVTATCGADPDLHANENEGRTAVTADPQDTRNGDSPCHEAA